VTRWYVAASVFDSVASLITEKPPGELALCLVLSYQAKSLHPMREQESAVPCREIPFSFRESPAFDPHYILSILGSAPIIEILYPSPELLNWKASTHAWCQDFRETEHHLIVK